MDLHDAIVSERPVLPDIDLEERVVQTNLSEVWRGRRRSDGSLFAVKFALTPEAVEALRSEADTVHALKASGAWGIVPADLVANPVPHLVLPWMGGRTLRHVIEGIKGPDDRARAMTILLDVVAKVTTVHARRFLHGDLKPENILIDDQGKPWLTDFGMARLIRTARLDSHVSRSMGASKDEWGGTINYLPPEGLHGEAPTAAWDVYAIGVMLHELLLGRRPDRAATPEDLRSTLPVGVVEVLLHALAYSPADRIPDANQLENEIRGTRFELTATGAARWALSWKRYILAGLAAFFVALRYTSVLVLLAAYLAIGLAAAFVNRSWVFTYIAVIALHAVIRWEGPESGEEALLRTQGRVVSNR